MHALTVTDLEGSRVTVTPDGLAAALGRRIAGANHFLLAPVDAPYPQLDVLVRDGDAVVHYFPAEGNAGSQSLAARAAPAAEAVFPANLTFEVLRLPGSTVIDVVAALRCAEEFAATLARPTLIDWLEL
jgi:hypothetical protein